jgi:O-methyltransferase
MVRPLSLVAFRKTTVFHLRKLARIFGYDLIKVRRGAYENHLPYGPVYPSASYSPWMKDADFEDTFQRFSPHSLVDRYRSYDLWEMAAQALKLEGAFLEVGVWRGGSGLLIAKRLRGLAPDRRVYLCDTFEGIVKSGEKDNSVTDGMYADTSAEGVRALAQEAGLTNVEVIKGIFPEAVASRFDKERFAFCHIDVDTYKSCEDSITWLWPRIVPFGIVIFDDYGFRGTQGVAAYVDAIKGQSGCLFVHNLNGHGILIKCSEEVPAPSADK